MAMTWQDLLDYCLAKPGAWQDEPWEGDVVVKQASQEGPPARPVTGGVTTGRRR